MNVRIVAVPADVVWKGMSKIQNSQRNYELTKQFIVGKLLFPFWRTVRG